jgi:hypothetical protein
MQLAVLRELDVPLPDTMRRSKLRQLSVLGHVRLLSVCGCCHPTGKLRN